MTPPIFPPADNLYKFIALFGLAISLFSLYKSADVFDALTKSKMEVEDLKFEINQSISYSTNTTYRISDTASINTVPIMLVRLSSDLNAMEDSIDNSSLEHLEKLKLQTKVRKMQVQNDNLRIKTTEFYITLGLGFVLMIVGFILWYKRDQSIKDKLLIKELSRVKEESMSQGKS